MEPAAANANSATAPVNRVAWGKLLEDASAVAVAADRSFEERKVKVGGCPSSTPPLAVTYKAINVH